MVQLRLISISFIYLCVCHLTDGQIQVSEIGNIEQDVQNLAGDGVIISNVSYSITGGEPIGVFKDDFGILGVQEGLVLTSGSAAFASGPNDAPCKTTVHQYEEVSSSELELLVEEAIYDLATVEFDITVSTNFLEFEYVFGSDEYPEFVDFDYHDVFGFFISGPGIDSVQNLAVIPNTQIPVSVGTINANSNSNYYVSNGNGNTPLFNIDVQYDGFTKPLKASIFVVPCEVYHVKLAIADVLDQTCDSGVFLQNKSFKARNIPKLEVQYEHDKYSFGLEECNDFDIIVTRGDMELEDLEKSVAYTYELLGSATDGDDYEMIDQPKFITIPAGEVAVSYSFKVLPDSLIEGEETVVFNISSGCDKFSEVVSLEIPIRDEIEYEIDDARFCGNQGVVLNDGAQDGYDLSWIPSEFLSCFNCQSPLATNTESTWFYYDVSDRETGCGTSDSVYVEREFIKADFNFDNLDCFTIQDIAFDNESENHETSFWEFGDGEFSTEDNPLHTFGSWDHVNVQAQFDVKLVVENSMLNCKDSTTKQVELISSLFIPNVITPNDDERNETFIIKGIIGECWVLTMYNRFGSQIYTNSHYQNEWNPKEQSDGVYYYHLHNEEKSRSFKGHILVVR